MLDNILDWKVLLQLLSEIFKEVHFIKLGGLDSLKAMNKEIK